ncbi:MAG TPA: ATP-binding protein [Actinomycetales bacterium]|nr:ATP-binding protein [Actinomycetales bacterium]
MPTVALKFTALPEHVRTARLVAMAVARRVGLGEETLEEVRLAVGEACVRAVSRTGAAGVGEPVGVQLTDDDGMFVVVVTDHAGEGAPSDVDQMSLTLVEGLAHDVQLGDGPGGPGGALRLVWRS